MEAVPGCLLDCSLSCCGPAEAPGPGWTLPQMIWALASSTCSHQSDSSEASVFPPGRVFLQVRTICHHGRVVKASNELPPASDPPGPRASAVCWLVSSAAAISAPASVWSRQRLLTRGVSGPLNATMLAGHAAHLSNFAGTSLESRLCTSVRSEPQSRVGPPEFALLSCARV